MNYYLRFNNCTKCKRYDELHIGKDSSGWKFVFQGFTRLISIISIEDWKKKTKRGKIFNEDGKRMNVKDFWEMVKTKRREKRNHSEEYPQGTWLDKHGNSFIGQDFS